MKITSLLIIFLLFSSLLYAQIKPLSDKRMYGNFTEQDSLYKGNKNLPRELILSEDTLIKEEVIKYLKKIDLDYIRLLALGEANNHKYFVVISQGSVNKLLFISKNFKHSESYIFSHKRTDKLSDADDEFTVTVYHKKTKRILKYKRVN